MNEPLIPLQRWLQSVWPVTDRTARRYELEDHDPLPVVRIGGRKYMRPSEGDAWLRRRAQHGASAQAQAETDELVTRAARTGESLDELYAQRRAG